MTLQRSAFEHRNLELTEEEKQIFAKRRVGPFMVVGSSGTGRVLIAAHRVKRLVSSRDWTRSDRLLITARSGALARNTASLVSRLIPERVMERQVEAASLEEWLSAFLRERGLPSEFLWPGDPRWEAAWEEAKALIPESPETLAKLSEDFWRSEFRDIILPLGIRTLSAYLEADRRGREIRMSDGKRMLAWPVFEAMRQALAKHGGGAVPFSDACFLALGLLRSGKARRRYRSVIALEAQDYADDVLKLLRALTPDTSERRRGVLLPQGDLFLVADEAAQTRCCARDLMRCGISVRSKRTFRLSSATRTTAEIRSAALLIREGSLAKILESRTKRTLYRDDECAPSMFGPLPELYCAKGPEDEAAWIARRVRFLLSALPSLRAPGIAVFAFSAAEAERLAASLEAHGVAAARLVSGFAPAADRVCVSTLPEAAGLEFTAVFIAGADEGQVPEVPGFHGADDPENLERLQGVMAADAMARARSLLFLSCSKTPGLLMRTLADYLAVFAEGETKEKLSGYPPPRENP